MKDHADIVLGEWAGEERLSILDKELASALSLPEYARWMAEDLRREADAIDAAVRDEEHSEAMESVDLAFAAKEDVPPDPDLEEQARNLELDAAGETDPTEKTRIRHQVADIRNRAREEAAATARAQSKEYAREQARGRLGRPDRVEERRSRLEKAAEIRSAADMLSLKASGIKPRSPSALLPSYTLDRHGCVFGSVGSGKTRLMTHLLEEQLRAGCSVLCVDPKPEAVREILSMALRVGLKPKDVIYVTPKEGSPVPGWNPFLIPSETPTSIARAMLGFVEGLVGAPGINMEALLVHSMHLCTGHRLSLYEVNKALTDAKFRDQLLALPRPDAVGDSFDKAVIFFKDSFPAWQSQTSLTAVRAASLRLDKLLDNAFVRNLLCSRENTLDLEDLWRRKTLIFFSLDRDVLDREAQKIVGGIVAYMTARAALRVGSPDGTRVVLALDELGTTEKFLGDELEDTVRFSRSQGLRVLIASQNVSSVSENLREALLGNAHLRVFFSLETKDAVHVAQSLAAASSGKREEKQRMTYRLRTIKRHGGGTTKRLKIVDGDGRPPVPRQFLPEDHDREAFIKSRIARFTERLSPPIKPPPAPDEMIGEFERAVRDVKELIKETGKINADQAERDWKNKGTTPSHVHNLYDSDLPATRNDERPTEISHTLTARLGIDERPDGTVTYFIEKILKPMGIEEPTELKGLEREGMRLLPSVPLRTPPSTEEQPKRRRAKPPERKKGFWEDLFSALFGAKSEIVRTLFNPKFRDDRAYEEFCKAEEFRNRIEYGYKTVAVPRYIAPYVKRRIAYELALDSYTLRYHEYEVDLGKPYGQVTDEAREAARSEYEHLKTEMRQQHLQEEQERAQAEYAEWGKMIVDAVASIRTDSIIGSLWVRPDPSERPVELPKYLSRLRAAGISATIPTASPSSAISEVLSVFREVWGDQEGHELHIPLAAVGMEAVPDTSPTTEPQWRAALHDIKNQHPATWIKGKEGTNVGIVKVASVPEPLPADSPELQFFTGMSLSRHRSPGFSQAVITQPVQAGKSSPTGSTLTETGRNATMPPLRRTLEDDE